MNQKRFTATALLHIRPDFCGCDAWARAGARQEGSISQHGSAGSVPYGIAMPRSPWREARLRHLLPRMLRLWSSEGDGYETAVQGTNGFVCNVDRSWMDPFEKSPEFWNPKRRGPVCYNPQAAKTLVPILVIRTKLALAGKSKAEMKERSEGRD